MDYDILTMFFSDISDCELAEASQLVEELECSYLRAKVYERSGAGNRHFCDLLAKIEDHINMLSLIHI